MAQKSQADRLKEAYEQQLAKQAKRQQILSEQKATPKHRQTPSISNIENVDSPSLSALAMNNNRNAISSGQDRRDTDQINLNTGR